MPVRLLRSWLLCAILCSAVSPATAHDATTRPTKSRSKPPLQTPRVTSIISATHPNLTQPALAAGSVLRIAGVGFGDAADARAVLKAAGVDDGVTLEILSWKDNEILLRLPTTTQLGIDATTAAELTKEVRAEKPLVSISASIDIMRGATRLVEPITLRIALAAFDFDGDGVLRAKDANDLDPLVR